MAREFLPGWRSHPLLDNEFAARLGFGKQKSQKDAERQLKRAEQEFESLETPTFNQYNPEYLGYDDLGPSAFNDIETGGANRVAQEEQLAALNNIAARGGRSAAGDAELNRITNRGQTLARGARGAIMQNAAARGTSGSGAALMAQLANQQNAQTQQNAEDLQVHGQNQANELAARGQAADLSGGLEERDYNQAFNKAKARDSINQFNAANRQGVNQYNVGIANQAQGINNDILQNNFENQYRKKSAKAGQYGQNANYHSNQADLNARTTGNLVGGAAKIGAAYAGAPGKAQGGLVEGQAQVPGDSQMNDTVPIMASAGEVVIPRSLAEGGSPDDLYNFVQDPPYPEDSYMSDGGGVDDFLRQSPNPMPAPQPSRDEQIMGMLQQEYDQGQDQQKQDREDALRSYYAANIGQGIEQMATAHGVARGNAPVDGSFYARLERKAPPRDVTARDQMIKMHLDKSGEDRKDARSVADRSSSEKIAGIKANKPTIPSSREAGVQSRHDENMNWRRNQEIMKTVDKMITPSGNRMVQKALLGRQSGQYIMDLFQQYPNLDDMPGIDVNLVSEEIGSLVGGGTGSDRRSEAVTAKTFESQWNEFMGKVDGKPTPAQLGAFLKQKKKYVEALYRTNDRIYEKYQNRVMERLGPLGLSDSEREMVKRAYEDKLYDQFNIEKGSPSPVTQAPSGNPSMKPAQGGQTPSQGPSAQDQAALKAALENPDTPESKAILKILKAKGMVP